jgi:hypothetical protein
MIRLASREAISLRVSGIMPGGGGWACPAIAATVRNASASMASHGQHIVHLAFFQAVP